MKGCDAHKSSNDPKLLKIKDAAASCAGVFRLLGSVGPSGPPPKPPCSQVVGCPHLLDR